VSNRRLEAAVSDAYDQATAWRFVAERLAAELALPEDRLQEAVIGLQQLQAVPVPANVGSPSGIGSSRRCSGAAG
jgi:hypothetical protein